MRCTHLSEQNTNLVDLARGHFIQGSLCCGLYDVALSFTAALVRLADGLDGEGTVGELSELGRGQRWVRDAAATRMSAGYGIIFEIPCFTP